MNLSYIVAIASDHAGYWLKTQIYKYLSEQKFRVIDCGTNNDQNKVDYPDLAKLVCEKIIEKDAKYGILICATGIGMSISANRNSSIRAALCTNELMAERARLHNDANILIIGSKVSDFATSIKMINKFFNTKFEGGRHLTRLEKIR